MATWNYQDEVIVCKYYLKHKEKSFGKIDELSGVLNNKFSLNSVRAKLNNFRYLDTGSGLSNYSFLSRFVYRSLTAKKKTSGLSKAGKGIQTSDVANSAVRNILTIISVYLGNATTDELIKTSEYFECRCPCTGRDLSEEIKARINGDKVPGVVLDHIIPQNRVSCGLNVYGNLIWMDEAANNRKGDKSFEDFILNDDEIVASTTLAERQARIDKIKEFQKYACYDAEKLREIISPMLEEYYKQVQNNQLLKAAEIVKKAKL